MRFLYRQPPAVPYHPPRDPEWEGELTLERVREIFKGCSDFAEREIKSTVTGEVFRLCWVDGMIKSERLNDYIIRPLITGENDTQPLVTSGTWNLNAQIPASLDEAVKQLIDGVVLIFGQERVVMCAVPTEEKRSISAPEDEVSVKGAKDSFVESVRTNTSLVRRHLKTPYLRVEQLTLGRESRTPVDLVWVQDLTNPTLVEHIRQELTQIDVDGLLSTGDLEQYAARGRGGTFPQMLFTERPDRFCRGILDGRVGVLIEGIPMGGLLPANLAQFLEAPQDRAYHWTIACALLAIRYVCMVVTLLLPAFYISVASFHFEMIPTKLAMSIITSKQDVPFSTTFEVLLLLLAFEVLQEAGIRLPKTIGQTVSIIGGLVVGQAAVDAKILSPAVVIVVAGAGIAGFTMPNQDLANALRIWRFLLAVLAGIAGVFGIACGIVLLVLRLARMESFGLAYLTPFARDAGQRVQAHAIFRQPIPDVKLRELSLDPTNRRRQR